MRWPFRKPTPAPDPDPLLTLFLHTAAWSAPERVHVVITLDRESANVVVTLRSCCLVRSLAFRVPARGSRVDEVAKILDKHAGTLIADTVAEHAQRATVTPPGGIDIGPIEFRLSEGRCE